MFPVSPILPPWSECSIAAHLFLMNVGKLHTMQLLQASDKKGLFQVESCHECSFGTFFVDSCDITNYISASISKILVYEWSVQNLTEDKGTSFILFIS